MKRQRPFMDACTVYKFLNGIIILLPISNWAEFGIFWCLLRTGLVSEVCGMSFYLHTRITFIFMLLHPRVLDTRTVLFSKSDLRNQRNPLRGGHGACPGLFWSLGNQRMPYTQSRKTVSISTKSDSQQFVS